MTGRTNQPRLLLFGATGTIGRAAARSFAARGWSVVAPIRASATDRAQPLARLGVDIRPVAAMDSATLARDAFAGVAIDAVVSCLASRTGAPADAWAVDHAANSAVLAAAQAAGVARFVYLSAICVQKPKLAFQYAKLAFEAELRAAQLDWTIVRPTAFFKSLSGQVDRVRAGKPYLLFGDGRGASCKPISDADLANFLADCVFSDDARRRVLPIGGPGPALTPREMGDMLFELTGRPARFRRIPVAAIGAIGGGLSLLGKISTKAADAAEFARIARYYATVSMLVWDAERARYDAEATPESGSDTLFEHYRAMLNGTAADDRGAHAVF